MSPISNTLPAKKLIPAHRTKLVYKSPKMDNSSYNISMFVNLKYTIKSFSIFASRSTKVTTFTKPVMSIFVKSKLSSKRVIVAAV